ncbi:MAG: MarC family protein [Parvularculaceae bacterium]
MMSNAYAISFFGALLAIMNPLAILPVFLSLTENADPARRRSEAVKTIIYCIVLCGVIAFSGKQILNFFGVTIDQFRVAGGLVLAGIAWTMLHGEPSKTHHGSGAEKESFKKQQGADPDMSIAFYPLAFPLLVGPGTITTLILFAHEATSRTDYLSFIAVVGAVLAIIAATLYFSGALGRFLNASARVVMTRLMGMILLSIAVGMMVTGLRALAAASS